MASSGGGFSLAGSETITGVLVAAGALPLPGSAIEAEGHGLRWYEILERNHDMDACTAGLGEVRQRPGETERGIRHLKCLLAIRRSRSVTGQGYDGTPLHIRHADDLAETKLYFDPKEFCDALEMTS